MAGVLCSMLAAVVTAVSRVAKTITAVGNAQVDTAQSKFGGASALFDGSGDYLQLATDSSLTFTGDFTIECWYRLPGAVPGIAPFFFNDHLFYLTNDGGVAKYAIFSGGNNRLLTGSVGTVSSGVFYHVAFVRSGSTLAAYHNGVSAGTSTYATTMTSQTDNYIGFYPASSFFNGHIDEYRISNIARYTGNFTPSTTPFVNDANTVLLIHADGTDGITFFEDDKGVRKSATPFGTGTQNISTTQSKFGGSSIFINASTGGSNSALNFLPPAEYSTLKWGDYTNYTIECWTYHTAWQPSGANNTGEGSSSVFQWSRQNGFTKNSFGFNEVGKMTLDYSTSSAYGGITIQESGTSGSLNTWQHIAMVKTGTSLKLYVNGTERASGTISGTVDFGSGAEWPRIGQGYWGGTFYMNEFRCSTVARYSSNFTAPTEPFVNDANTVVLLHGNGSNNTTVYRDDNG
jgi:hypothetical protein